MKDKMKYVSSVEDSNSTLASTTSMISGSQRSSTTASNEKNGDLSNVSDTESEFSYNECDITLVDDIDTIKSDPKNEAEMMFLQVMEVLRYEQEVSSGLIFFHFYSRRGSQRVNEAILLKSCSTPTIPPH